MKTNSEFTEFNNMTRRRTIIFNSFKLNRCLSGITYPQLTKTRHFIARRFAANVTSLTGKVGDFSSNLYNSVCIQNKKYSTNFSIFNNEMVNKKINKNLTTLPKDPLKTNWVDYYFKINSIIIPDLHLKNALNKFYKEKIFNLDKDTTIVIQFKIKIDDKTIRSISFLQTVKVSEFNELFEIFKEFWIVKGTEYNYDYPQIASIIFTYRVLSLKKFKMITSNFYRSPIENLEKKKHKINGFNLPNTMDFSTWGDYEISDDYKYAIVHKYKSKAKYYIKIKENSLNVDLKLNGKILYQFTDTRLDKENLTYFSRKLKTHSYIYKDGNLIIKEIERKSNYLKPIKKNLNLNKDFITMDLETITTKGIMIPVCISIYDGKNVSSFYLSNFEN